VRRIENVLQVMHVNATLDRIAADKDGVFARAPRHVVLHERWDKHRQLLEAVLARWTELPVAAFTVECVTLRRDAQHTRVEIDGAANDWWLAPLSRALEPASIALTNCSDELTRATREAFPRVPIA
jgi:hypothetical protein